MRKWHVSAALGVVAALITVVLVGQLRAQEEDQYVLTVTTDGSEFACTGAELVDVVTGLTDGSGRPVTGAIIGVAYSVSTPDESSGFIATAGFTDEQGLLEFSLPVPTGQDRAIISILALRRPPLTLLDAETLILACPFVPDPGEITVSGQIRDVDRQRGIRHERISVSMGSGLEDFIPDHTTKTAKGGYFQWEGVPVTFVGDHRRLCLAEGSKYEIVAVNGNAVAAERCVSDAVLPINAASSEQHFVIDVARR